MSRKEYIRKYNLISDKCLKKTYSISSRELFQLLADGKLKPYTSIGNLFFNRADVQKHFCGETNDEHPLVINTQNLIQKYNLSKLEFAKLLESNELIPLPFKNESNLWFEYSEACKLLNNKIFL